MTDLNDEINKDFELREEYYRLNKIAEEAEKAYKQQHALVIQMMLDQNLTTAGTDVAKVSLSEEVVPQVDDWDKVHEYVKENDALFILQRRINSGPWKEALNNGELIPGTSTFTRHKLSLRKA